MKKIKDVPMVETDYMPSLHVHAKQLPQIKNWKLGKEYELEVKVKMTSQSIENWRGEGETTATFEIKEIKAEE